MRNLSLTSASAYGYQSVPVNWTISSPRKRDFFELLAKVTGFSP